MRNVLLLTCLGLVVLPDPARALSENERLSCVKELPNPYSLAARQHYVLSCTTKVGGMTITSISANADACVCQIYGSTKRMKPKARFMSICRLDRKPCDFTDVTFETDTDTIVFTWDPDVDDFDLR